MRVIDVSPVRMAPATRWLAPMLAMLLLGCGSGESDRSDASNGGIVGFATGNETPGAVPSDGRDPAAPVITSVSASTPTIEYGQPIRIQIVFTDQQGDVAMVNFGIAGQSTHSTLSAAIVGTQTSGGLILELYPRTYQPGTYILIVSMTDQAGHTSLATSITFTVVGPGGTIPPSTVDAAPQGGADASIVDAGTSRQPDAPRAPDAAPRGDGPITPPDAPAAGKDTAADGRKTIDGGATVDGGAVVRIENCSDGTTRKHLNDDFSAGINASYWTVTHSTPGLFSVDGTQGDVRLTKTGTNSASGVQNVFVHLNLAAALGAPISGDFEASVSFRNAVLGTGGVDQVEFHASFADNSIFYDVYDNSSGINTHTWNGTSIAGITPTSATGGTFRIVRTGNTVSGYFGSTLLSSTSSTSALSVVSLALQLQPGVNDPISVIFDDFHVQSGSATCAQAGTGQCLNDDFATGMRANYWTVTQTTPGLFSVDGTQGDVRLTKTGTNSASGVQYVFVQLNLAAVLGAPISGDFETSVSFRNAVLGTGGVDQVEFHASFADNSIFYDVYDNSSGINTHTWNGTSIAGITPTSATGGTFRIVRTGNTVSGYFGSTLLSSTSSTSALSIVSLALQLQPGVNDPISVIFDDFHIQGGSGPCATIPSSRGFSDDFSSGVRTSYWTVDQTTAGLFSIDGAQGDVRLAKAAANSASSVQSITVILNMAAAVGGPISGDFEVSVAFRNATLGSGGVDQVELHTGFADKSIFYDVYDNSSGINTHTWNGSSIAGITSTSATGGTFRIVRTGNTVSGYFGSTLLSSTSSTSALSAVGFVLQLQPGVNDPISVIFDDFRLTY